VNAYIFSTQAGAQACQTAVDSALGYPKVGIEVGGGIHVKDPNTGGPFVTQTYAQVLKHPTLPQYAYPADATSTGILSPNAVSLGLPAPTALDATWNGATALVVQAGP
jgi:hypothetical protein